MENSNLIPIPERTKDEQREITTAGGVASGKARRRKKMMRDTILAALDGKMDGSELTNEQRIVVALLESALTKGKDGNADRRLLMDWLGEGKSTTAVEVSKPEDVMAEIMKKLK
jgi:hypothetical protein